MKIEELLVGIKDFGNERKEKEFVEKIRSIPNLEEKFEMALNQNEKWRSLAETEKPQCLLRSDVEAPTENLQQRIELEIMDQSSRQPIPVIILRIKGMA